MVELFKVKDVTFYSDDFGKGLALSVEGIEKKLKRKSDHKDFQYLQELKTGDFVKLIPNSKGAGYFINKPTSEELMATMGEVSSIIERPAQNGNIPSPETKDSNKINNIVDVLMEIDEKIREKINLDFYTPKEVECFVLSVFIQYYK